jgi:endonuclease YncB( thermonuclease family)
MARTRAVVVATVAAASVLGASVLGWWLGGLARAAQPVARVVEVIDGDTVGRPPIAHRHRPAARRRHTRDQAPDEGCAAKAGLEAAPPSTRRSSLARVRRRAAIHDRRLAYVTVRGHRFNDVLVERGYASS